MTIQVCNQSCKLAKACKHLSPSVSVRSRHASSLPRCWLRCCDLHVATSSPVCCCCNISSWLPVYLNSLFWFSQSGLLLGTKAPFRPDFLFAFSCGVLVIFWLLPCLLALLLIYPFSAHQQSCSASAVLWLKLNFRHAAKCDAIICFLPDATQVADLSLFSLPKLVLCR